MAPIERNRLVLNMPFAEYAAAEGINNSGLIQLLRSPAHYRCWRTTPQKPPTPALVLGKITHLCVLEPDEYEATVVVMSKKLSKAEQQQALLERPEAVLVSQEIHDKAQAMRDAVWRNADARKLLTRGHREAGIWWQDPDFKVLCKARVDFVSMATGKGVVLDLKTTMDASRTKFSRSMVDYRYDMQAAHYLAAGQASGCYGDEEFYFLAVEKEPPYAAVVYAISDVVRGVGNQWRDEAMSRYTTALRDGQWPGLAPLDEIGLPKWAKVPGEDEENIT